MSPQKRSLSSNVDDDTTARIQQTHEKMRGKEVKVKKEEEGWEVGGKKILLFRLMPWLESLKRIDRSQSMLDLLNSTEGNFWPHPHLPKSWWSPLASLQLALRYQEISSRFRMIHSKKSPVQRIIIMISSRTFSTWYFKWMGLKQWLSSAPWNTVRYTWTTSPEERSSILWSPLPPSPSIT